MNVIEMKVAIEDLKEENQELKKQLEENRESKKVKPNWFRILKKNKKNIS